MEPASQIPCSWGFCQQLRVLEVSRGVSAWRSTPLCAAAAADDLDTGAQEGVQQTAVESGREWSRVVEDASREGVLAECEMFV